MAVYPLGSMICSPRTRLSADLMLYINIYILAAPVLPGVHRAHCAPIAKFLQKYIMCKARLPFISSVQCVQLKSPSHWQKISSMFWVKYWAKILSWNIVQNIEWSELLKLHKNITRYFCADSLITMNEHHLSTKYRVCHLKRNPKTKNANDAQKKATNEV